MSLLNLTEIDANAEVRTQLVTCPQCGDVVPGLLASCQKLACISADTIDDKRAEWAAER